MIRVLCLLGVLGAAALQPTEAPAQWPPWLFVIAGQSNAYGDPFIPIIPGPTSLLLVGAQGADLQWYTASEALVGPGPALPFAAALRERTNAPIGLIQCARGGSAILEWAPSNDPATLYGACRQRILAARAIGTFKGLLWDQGERDATLRPEARPYEWAARFQTIAQAVRADTGTPSLPVVWAVLGPTLLTPADVPNWPIVQYQQRAVSLGLGMLVETTGLPLEDTVHYSRAGYQDLGRRFATAWWDGLAPACGCR